MQKSLSTLRAWSLFVGLMLLLCGAYAQRSVSGKVVSTEDNSPLIGANVLVKGTATGALTNENGEFTLSVPNNDAVLVVSYIGFVRQEVAVGSQNQIEIRMTSDASTLDEVVVTGYTAQRKGDITGAVTVIDAGDITALPTASLTQQLQGRAPGVIVGNDNSPGGGTMVRIRGFGTINNNSPLYIIDGVPTKGTLNQLNPNDIETIQVLKDASAASIYGARAANGVVIITTKKGRPGEPKITFEAYTGTQTPGKLLDLLNSEELGQLIWESENNVGRKPTHGQYGSGATPVIPDYIYPSGAFEGDARVNPANYTRNISDPEFGKSKFLITRANKEGTNWLDEIFDPAPIYNAQLGASGGSNKGTYAISFNYFSQDGILKFTNYDRYSVRANTQFNVRNKFRIGENFTVSYDERVGITNQNESNPITFALRSHPLIPVFDITGFYAGGKGSNLGNAKNAYAELERNKDDVLVGLHLLGNGFAELDIVKGLTARTSIGIEYNTFNLSNYTIQDIEAAEAANTNGLTVSNSYDNSWTWFNTLNYSGETGSHSYSALVGTEAVATYAVGFNASRSGFAFDDISYRYLNAGNAAGLNNSGGGASQTRLFSIFGKVNYGFKSKYLADFTIRRDGSSRFGSEFRYGVFPAFSLGWRISEESFMKSLSFITDLKLRGGWGQTGNQEIPSLYNAFTLFLPSPTDNSYDITGSGKSIVPGFDLELFGNPAGKWETNTSTNIGFDAYFLNNSLEVVFDWYDRRTTDMLVRDNYQATQGEATVPFINIGEIKNTGIDVGITYRGQAMGGDFRYDVGVNFSQYTNEVLKINNNPNQIIFGFSTRIPPMSATTVGRPIASYYGYYVDGIFQSDDEAKAAPQFGTYNRAGSFKFRDVNGDGVVTPADRTFIGSPHPDFSYGINVNVGYKNFDLTVFGQGVQGNEIFNYVRYWTDFQVFQGNRSKRMLEDSWRPGKTDAILPQLRSTDATSQQVSTYFLEDGSYLRLKNVQLSYSLPNRLTERLGIGSLQVYVQGQNILTLTNYTGMDPDINLRSSGSDNQDTHLGVDEGAYPVAKSYLVGLRLGL